MPISAKRYSPGPAPVVASEPPLLAVVGAGAVVVGVVVAALEDPEALAVAIVGEMVAPLGAVVVIPDGALLLL